MAQNYIQPGDRLQVTAPVGGYTSGQIVAAGEFVGVSLGTYADGDTAVIAICGVYEVAKEAPQAQAQGVKLYFDSANARLTTSDGSGANKFAGWAWETAASADTTVQVRLQF